MKGAPDIGEREGNITGQRFGEDGGQGREGIVCADSDARESAIGEDESGSDGVDVLLGLVHNTLLVELVLLTTTGVS
jgi:hypothetical protein